MVKNSLEFRSEVVYGQEHDGCLKGSLKSAASPTEALDAGSVRDLWKEVLDLAAAARKQQKPAVLPTVAEAPMSVNGETMDALTSAWLT